MQKFFRLPEITVRILVRPTIGHLLYLQPPTTDLDYLDQCGKQQLKVESWKATQS